MLSLVCISFIALNAQSVLNCPYHTIFKVGPGGKLHGTPVHPARGIVEGRHASWEEYFK